MIFNLLLLWSQLSVFLNCHFTLQPKHTTQYLGSEDNIISFDVICHIPTCLNKKAPLFLAYLFFMSKFHFQSVTSGNLNMKIQVEKMGRRPKNSSRGRKQYKKAVEKTQHVLPVPAVSLLKWPSMVVEQSTKIKPENLGSNWFWWQLFVYNANCNLETNASICYKLVNEYFSILVVLVLYFYIFTFFSSFYLLFITFLY